MHTSKLLLLMFIASIALAPSTVGAFPVSWGSSWDGPGNDLQSIVNNYLGGSAINVQTDYIGHDAGDPDPFYWRLGGAANILVHELANNSAATAFGWYRRPAVGSAPVIDGVNDGVIFPGPALPGNTYVLDLLALYGSPVQVGFYISTPASGWNTAGEQFFTDRRYNDVGLTGTPLHAPFDGGDPQCLVYDLSSVRGYESYLLAWEDLDTGGPVGYTSDNDFNDLLVEMTPTTPVPEPGTLTLLSGGLLGLIGMIRRRSARV
jgi:hypothetical protein